MGDGIDRIERRAATVVLERLAGSVIQASSDRQGLLHPGLALAHAPGDLGKVVALVAGVEDGGAEVQRIQVGAVNVFV